MKTFSFDVVVFGGPSATARSQTVFHTVLKSESLRSAVASLVGIFSGCSWYAIRAYVSLPESSWMSYVTLYDSDTGISCIIDKVTFDDEGC